MYRHKVPVVKHPICLVGPKSDQLFGLFQPLGRHQHKALHHAGDVAQRETIMGFLRGWQKLRNSTAVDFAQRSAHSLNSTIVNVDKSDNIIEFNKHMLLTRPMLTTLSGYPFEKCQSMIVLKMMLSVESSNESTARTNACRYRRGKMKLLPPGIPMAPRNNCVFIKTIHFTSIYNTFHIKLHVSEEKYKVGTSPEHRSRFNLPDRPIPISLCLSGPTSTHGPTIDAGAPAALASRIYRIPASRCHPQILHTKYEENKCNYYL